MPKKYRTKTKFRSKLEEAVHEKLVEFLGTRKVKYETEKLKYTIPESEHTYTPDFKVGPGKYIEAKGIFDADDRQKILLIKQQHPDIEVLMVFGNANLKIYKGSKTTYGNWCDKHGVRWCDVRRGIPSDWFD